MELEDDVPVGDALAVADVADPVVRQIRTDQHEVSGGEAADVVSDDGPARAVLDQVDLELGMVVPAAVRARVVVHVPAGRGVGHRRHELAGRRFSNQLTRLNDRFPLTHHSDLPTSLNRTGAARSCKKVSVVAFTGARGGPEPHLGLRTSGACLALASPPCRGAVFRYMSKETPMLNPSAVLYGPHDVRIEDRPVPEASPGQVL